MNESRIESDFLFESIRDLHHGWVRMFQEILVATVCIVEIGEVKTFTVPLTDHLEFTGLTQW